MEEYTQNALCAAVLLTSFQTSTLRVIFTGTDQFTLLFSHSRMSRCPQHFGPMVDCEQQNAECAQSVLSCFYVFFPFNLHAGVLFHCPCPQPPFSKLTQRETCHPATVPSPSSAQLPDAGRGATAEVHHAAARLPAPRPRLPALEPRPPPALPLRPGLAAPLRGRWKRHGHALRRGPPGPAGGPIARICAAV